MFIKKITLTDFKNYEGTHSFDFEKLNLVKGKNGAGKSTLALNSVLFAIYGYAEQSLSTLQTRSKKNAQTSVEIELEHSGKHFYIKRAVPTELTIKVDGVELKLVNTVLKQEELNKIFKNVDYFRKFRMIDVKQGINLLEEGKTSLRKSLISFNDSMFNNIRQRLLDKKKQREIYNKDTAVLYTHFPSSERLHVLEVGILNCTEQIYALDKDLRDNERDLSEMYSKKGTAESGKRTWTDQKNKLMSSSACPLCKHQLPEELKEKLLKEANTNIQNLNDNLGRILDEMKAQVDAVEYIKSIKTKHQTVQNKLQQLRIKLESRLKQKDYIWTTKDVLIMKKAVEEIDSFMSFYITEWVKALEPIINNIITTLPFKVVFDINAKGDFEIQLMKGDTQYSYKDLSSGQKLVLTIAFQLALLIEKGDDGLVIADEGFSSLDEDNLNTVFDLFKNLPFQLVCILHRLDNVSLDIKVFNI